MNGLARALVTQAKYPEAGALLLRPLDLRRRVLGQEHKDTMGTAVELALLWQAEGKFAASEPLAREAVQADTKNLPDDWPRFLAQSVLGASLAGQQKYEEAEPLLLAGYPGMEARKARIAAPDLDQRARARARIVQLYRAWGKPAEAASWAKAE